MRPTPLLVALSLLAGVARLGAPPAAAGPLPGIRVAAASPAVVADAPDWATEELHDPIDFNTQLDLNPGRRVTDLRRANGVLSFTTRRTTFLDPVYTSPGALPHDRDGALHPVDTTRYSRLSIRMRASARSSTAVLWFSCAEATLACADGTTIPVHSGWGTYDIPLRPALSAARQPWQGRVTGIRIIPTNRAGVRFDLDWIRIYQPTAASTVLWSDPTPGRSAAVYWDRDSDFRNNTPERGGWGIVARVARSGPVNQTPFNAAAFPPDTYRFYVVAAGERSPHGGALRIAPAPQPTIDDPDRAGGADYASSVRRDAWDFSQPGDVRALWNARRLGGAAGVLHAMNSGSSNRNDPQVHLPLGATIDGSRWHRLTFRLSYDGPFGLANAPGGGAMTRIIWGTAAAPGQPQELEDVVTYPWQREITVDLAASLPGAITDPTQRARRLGWAGQRITSLRFDPNEDPGPRVWHLDSIRIAEDDRADSSFDVTFHDDAWEPGTVATLHADRDARGHDGEVIAVVPVTAGRNVVRWDTSRLVPGRYWVHVAMQRGVTSGRAYATGPVLVTHE